jgi:hypothetical protein
VFVEVQTRCLLQAFERIHCTTVLGRYMLEHMAAYSSIFRDTTRHQLLANRDHRSQDAKYRPSQMGSDLLRNLEEMITHREFCELMIISVTYTVNSKSTNSPSRASITLEVKASQNVEFKSFGLLRAHRVSAASVERSGAK